MKKNVIVSLADSNYFELLDELVNSIKSFEKSKDTAICILDAGLSAEQKEILSKKVDEIKPAEWDIEVPAIKVFGKEWLKSQVSRAFLPKYFPNYEKYLWIDCDAWVNDWKSLSFSHTSLPVLCAKSLWIIIAKASTGSAFTKIPSFTRSPSLLSIIS